MNIHNEQIKLTATYFNGLAIALAAIGGLQPLLVDPFASPFTAAKIGICLMVSVLLHLLGQATLTGLRP